MTGGETVMSSGHGAAACVGRREWACPRGKTNKLSQISQIQFALAFTPVMMYNIIIMNSPRKWHVLYFDDAKGYCQTLEFIGKRTNREKAKILAWIDQLEQQGPNLPRPYADLLEDGIHELRIKLSGDQSRILYFFCFRDFIVFTNVFIKTTDKVPKNEIQTAKRCRADFLVRYNEQALRRMTNENL
jgi:phage-related protein